MSPGQKRIAEVMVGHTVPTASEREVFIGMLQAGEVTIRDFEMVGGWKLAYQMADTFFHADHLSEVTR